MPIEMGASNASIVTLILTSSVLSGVITAGVNVFMKTQDRKHDAAKDKAKVAHAYFETAIWLEDFAKNGSGHIGSIDEAMASYDADHDTSAFAKLHLIEHKLELVMRLGELPVSVVAQVKALTEGYTSAHDWISRQFDHWADLEEAYQMERQRVAFYGLQALTMAATIRQIIAIEPHRYAPIVKRFETIVESCRQAFWADAEERILIPDLKAQFENEGPGVLPPM
jgi:hypothetical protein